MKICRSFLIFLTVVLLSATFVNGKIEIILSNLKDYSTKANPDKIYVHSDRSTYALEDTIWLKTYLVDGITHIPEAASKVVYIEVQSPTGNIVNSQKVYIDNIGAASDIIIPRDWQPGIYNIRAYSQHMLNQDPDFFYNKKVEIVDINKAYVEIFESSVEAEIENVTVETVPLDISFYPESGELIASIDCKVAIKIKGGQAEGLNGTIQTKNGGTVAPFKIFKFGLGIASFIPEVGESYVAQLDGQAQTYPLPDVMSQGYTMTTVRKNDDITLILQTNISNGLDGGKIIGHQRGELLLDQDIGEGIGSDYSFKFSMAPIPSGIVTMTFFDKNGIPHCERLLFVDNSEVKTVITSDKSSYGIRDKVSLELMVDDEREPLAYDCSVAIVDNNNVNSFPQGRNIKTWLLLNSDLRGKIENPSYFFEKHDDYKRDFLLDLIMMTNGWRKFSWREMSKEDAYASLKHGREDGIYIEGYTSKVWKSKSGLKSNVTLTFLSSELLEDQMETDDDGKFRFGPYIVYDTIQALLQARKYKNEEQGKLEGNRNVVIHIDDNSTTPITSVDKIPTNKKSISYSEYVSSSRTTQALKDQYHTMEIMLDEIVLTEKRETKEDEIDQIVKDKSIYGEPSNRVILKDVDRVGALSVFDLLRRVPGVIVSGTFPNQIVSIRGLSSINLPNAPLFLIDGMQTEQEFISQMNTNDVLFIDVLKGVKAAIYGSRAANGVIAIYTGAPDPSVSRRKPGIIDMSISGFSVGREFYSPDYSRDVSEVYTPDGRTTLYWNPMVALESNRSMSLDFYTGDNPGTYQIQIEGIGRDGSLISQTEEIIVH